VSYGRRPEICTDYNISGDIIEKNENINDLGVTFDNKLKFDDHISNKISTAYRLVFIDHDTDKAAVIACVHQYHYWLVD